jgi:hypothetical protein
MFLGFGSFVFRQKPKNGKRRPTPLPGQLAPLPLLAVENFSSVEDLPSIRRAKEILFDISDSYKAAPSCPGNFHAVKCLIFSQPFSFLRNPSRHEIKDTAVTYFLSGMKTQASPVRGTFTFQTYYDTVLAINNINTCSANNYNHLE